MYPPHHFFFGLAFSLSLLVIFPQIGLTGFFIILSSSVLIDIDHYIYYAYKKKDFNLIHAYAWFVNRKKKFILKPRTARNKYFAGIYFLHGFEVLFVLSLAAIFLSKNFLFVLVAFNFHLLLDIIETKRYIDRPIKLSLIYDIISSRKLKVFN